MLIIEIITKIKIMIEATTIILTIIIIVTIIGIKILKQIVTQQLLMVTAIIVKIFNTGLVNHTKDKTRYNC